MKGTYHFECQNSACDFGTIIKADDMESATITYFRMHDENSLQSTGNAGHCGGDHYCVTTPSGKTLDF